MYCSAAHHPGVALSERGFQGRPPPPHPQKHRHGMTRDGRQGGGSAGGELLKEERVPPPPAPESGRRRRAKRRAQGTPPPPPNWDPSRMRGCMALPWDYHGGGTQSPCLAPPCAATAPCHSLPLPSPACALREAKRPCAPRVRPPPRGVGRLLALCLAVPLVGRSRHFVWRPYDHAPPPTPRAPCHTRCHAIAKPTREPLRDQTRVRSRGFDEMSDSASE